MKLSMWHIWQALEEFQPEHSIVDGAPRIAGFHIIPMKDDGVRESQYAYIQLPDVKRLSALDDDATFTVLITNGPDTITLRNVPDTSVIVNRLMALLAAFNSWESRLRLAADRGDLQEIVDIATEQLSNPILLFDMQSNVLAMSALYLDDDRNPFWNSCRDERRVPIGYTAQAMTLENGESASWTREPTRFRMADGQSIGNFLSVDGEIVAGFALHEADNPILPGDMHLVRLTEAMLVSALKPWRDSGVQRSLLITLQDMLSGVRFEDHVYDLFRLPCEAPWRLLIVDIPQHLPGNPMYRQLLVPRLRSLVPDCVAMEFDTFVVVLASADRVDALVRIINGDSENRYFSICLSLPFDSLRLLRTRYEQARFIAENRDGGSGVFYGEDYVLRYLSRLNIDREHRLAHPLLKTLKEQDAKKGSALYETLFQYLLNERSIQKGAAALHVHKNTYSYRLERIRELTNVDLDDPFTRLYLMLSYVTDGAADQAGEGR